MCFITFSSNNTEKENQETYVIYNNQNFNHSFTFDSSNKTLIFLQKND